MNQFFSLFGIPETILSDQGTEFTSDIIKQLTKLYKIKHILCSVYHPESNGGLERSHSVLKSYLKHFLNDNQNNWDILIPHAMFCYNTHTHEATGKTPYELLFGRPARIPSSIANEPEFKYTYDDYYSQLKLRLNAIHKLAKEKLIQSKLRSKIQYDKKLNPHIFKINDLVLIKAKANKPGLNKKLSPTFHGPYRIIKINPNNNTVVVQLKHNKKVTYHTDMLKPYFTDENEDQSSDSDNDN